MNKSMYASLLTAAFLCAIPVGCFAVDKQLTAEKPLAEAFRTILNKEISTLNIPIEMSTDELAKVLNLTIRKELYKGATKSKSVSTDVMRNGPIEIGRAHV